MNFKSIFLFFLLIAISSNISAKGEGEEFNLVTSITLNDPIITHIVGKGETVYSIATQYDTTVDAIYKLNPNAKKGIRVGDKLQIPKTPSKPTGYRNYVIEAKETLYSVSKSNGVSVEELKNANAGLDEKSFQQGKTIRIPLFDNSVSKANKPIFPSAIEHKVAKGETLYSIGRIHNVSVESLLANNPSLNGGSLKENMILHIVAQSEAKPNEVVTQPQEKAPVSIEREDGVRIGVLFSFLDKNSTIQQDKITEYYQGFLLAIKALKEKGYNAEIYTFDIGEETNTKKLESLLGTTEINNLNLIIGGTSKQQIDILTKFSKKTGIKYAIPFDSKHIAVQSNQTIFRITTSPSDLYSELNASFYKQFRDCNIVFLSEIGSDNNKSQVVAELKKGLTKENIQYTTTGSSVSLINDLKKALSTSKRNVVIPTSSSETTLKRIFAAMQSYQNYEVSLFGYPEWQTYTQMNSDFHKNDTYIYSIFFLNDNQPEVTDFVRQYKQWYNKSLINSYPRYALLGYDAALYFVMAMNKYGAEFDSVIPAISVPTLQSAIHFEQENNKSGYINTGLYFVHYKPDSTIEKIEYKK